MARGGRTVAESKQIESLIRRNFVDRPLSAANPPVINSTLNPYLFLPPHPHRRPLPRACSLPSIPPSQQTPPGTRPEHPWTPPCLSILPS